MNFKEKEKRLIELYGEFETQALKYKEKAICKPGCAYCCIHFGSVDMITLEGLIIRKRINDFAEPLKKEVKKRLPKTES